MEQRNNESTTDRRLFESVLATWLVFTQGKKWGCDLESRNESAKWKEKTREMNQNYELEESKRTKASES